jgi:hypothetical protein
VTAQQRRLALLSAMNFGVKEGFNGSPLAELTEIRSRIIANAWYKTNPRVQTYFQLVENNLELVSEAHPLLGNFNKLTIVMGALVDDAPDRDDVFKDLLDAEKAKTSVWDSIPAWVLTSISSSVLVPISNAFWVKVQSSSDMFAKILFDQIWRIFGLVLGSG